MLGGVLPNTASVLLVKQLTGKWTSCTLLRNLVLSEKFCFIARRQFFYGQGINFVAKVLTIVQNCFIILFAVLDKAPFNLAYGTENGTP